MRKKQKDAAADTTIAEAAAEASGEQTSKPGSSAPAEGTRAESSTKKKAGSGPGGRLSPLDIQQVEFRRGFKGYDEREVDEFLDRLTEDFAGALDESQRLRARLESGLSSVGTSAPSDAGAEAERIVERARTEAAGIIRDAEAAAARKGSSAPAGGGAPAGRAAADRPAVSEFLNSEREFLKHLASLVQGHVDDVKSMAAKQPRTKLRAAATPKPAEASKPAAQTSRQADQTSRQGGPGPRCQNRTGAAPDSARQGAKVSPPRREPQTTTKKAVEPVSSVEIVVDDAETAAGASSAPAEKQAVPARAASGDPSSSSGSPGEEEDPSLRELFWGED